jgi:hypothetical protein
MCNFIFYFIVFFLNILVSVKNKENFYENPKWIIVLTTCVTPIAYIRNETEINERKQQYENSIRDWINKTTYPIFVVENSGHDFKNLQEEFKNKNRLFVYSYKTTESVTNSIGEHKSLKYVLDNAQNNEEYKKCQYILKVTGKYFLPNIENVLNDKTKPEYTIYLQKYRKTNVVDPEQNYQNSEYFGMHKNTFNEFIYDSKIDGKYSMERFLHDFSEKQKQYITVLGTFKNENNIKRTDGSLLTELFSSWK